MPIENKLLRTITKTCEDKKAFDIKVLNVKEKTSICSFIVIASVHSRIQIKAIIEELRLKLKNERSFIKDGDYLSSDWIAIDLGDIFVHLFMPEERLRYKLDELWKQRPKNKNIINIE